jgi:CheY-like chemotaxis protein
MERVWNILVIDDMPQLAGLVEKYSKLIDYNCQFRWASTLSRAEHEINLRQPHLIVLDLHMPGDTWKPSPVLAKEFGALTTLAFCKRIVTDPKLTKIAVVLVSVDDQVRDLGKKAGAHGFYNKYDFTLERFEGILQKLSMRHQQGSP